MSAGETASVKFAGWKWLTKDRNRRQHHPRVNAAFSPKASQGQKAFRPWEAFLVLLRNMCRSFSVHGKSAIKKTKCEQRMAHNVLKSICFHECFMFETWLALCILSGGKAPDLVSDTFELTKRRALCSFSIQCKGALERRQKSFTLNKTFDLPVPRCHPILMPNASSSCCRRQQHPACMSASICDYFLPPKVDAMALSLVTNIFFCQDEAQFCIFPLFVKNRLETQTHFTSDNLCQPRISGVHAPFVTENGKETHLSRNNTRSGRQKTNVTVRMW